MWVYGRARVHFNIISRPGCARAQSVSAGGGGPRSGSGEPPQPFVFLLHPHPMMVFRSSSPLSRALASQALFLTRPGTSFLPSLWPAMQPRHIRSTVVPSPVLRCQNIRSSRYLALPTMQEQKENRSTLRPKIPSSVHNPRCPLPKTLQRQRN